MALPLLKHTFFQPSPEDTKRLISVFVSVQNRSVVGIVETAPRQVAVFFPFEDAVVFSSQRLRRSDLGSWKKHLLIGKNRHFIFSLVFASLHPFFIPLIPLPLLKERLIFGKMFEYIK